MATEILVKVYADGSGDYTSLKTAWDANKQNLVAADSYMLFEMSGDLRNTDAFVDASGYTTDATRNIRIKARSGEEATSIAGAGAMYGTNTYPLVCRSQFIEFDCIEIDGWTKAFHSSANITIKNCLFHDGTTPLNSTAGASFENCIGYNLTDNSLTDTNCNRVTLVNSIAHSVSHSALFRDASGLIVDCVGFNENSQTNGVFFNTTNAGNDNNASDDGSAPGTTTYTVSTTDFVDYANDNLNIAPASPLFTAGAGGESVGAVLPVGGGGGVTVTALLNSNYMVEYSMKKNVAGQSIGAQMVTISDGSDFTGTVTAEVTIDNGTKTTGGGSVTHEGEGYHSYAPTQAETNGDHIAFSFAGTGALTQTIQVYTTFPQTVDNDVAISALNDFDPTSDAVANVTLVATTTTNTDMRGTDSANTVVPPSVAQFNARTLASGDYFVVDDYTAPDNASITSILADTNELQLNQGNWLTATGFSTTAEIADVPTVAEFNARTLPSASYSQFDYTANEVSANIAKINGVTITGDGSGSPFDV